MSEVNVLDPRKFEDIESAVMTPANFNPEKGEKGKVKFTLKNPGMVRVYIRPKEKRFIVVKNLIQFEDKKNGTYELEWDGRDSKGNILDPSKYRITIEAQPIRGSITESEVPWDPDPHLRDEGVLLFKETNKRVHAHCFHDKKKCTQLDVKIISPKPGETVKGKVKVVREVSKDTIGYGNHHGHSARFYVDYFLLQENKDERTQTSEWIWDTSDIPPGKHLLTATACDHHDHMGSDSIIINIVK